MNPEDFKFQQRQRREFKPIAGSRRVSASPIAIATRGFTHPDAVTVATLRRFWSTR